MVPSVPTTMLISCGDYGAKIGSYQHTNMHVHAHTHTHNTHIQYRHMSSHTHNMTHFILQQLLNEGGPSPFLSSPYFLAPPISTISYRCTTDIPILCYTHSHTHILMCKLTCILTVMQEVHTHTHARTHAHMHARTYIHHTT